MSREERYHEAARRVGVDALHEMIYRYGLGILDYGLPYIAKKVFWRWKDSERRKRRLRCVKTAIRHQQSAPRDQMTMRMSYLQLESVLSELDPVDQKILKLTCEDASVEELCKETGMPEGTIRCRKKRALDKIRGMIL